MNIYKTDNELLQHYKVIKSNNFSKQNNKKMGKNQEMKNKKK